MANLIGIGEFSAHFEASIFLPIFAGKRLPRESCVLDFVNLHQMVHRDQNFSNRWTRKLFIYSKLAPYTNHTTSIPTTFSGVTVFKVLSSTFPAYDWSVQNFITSIRASKRVDIGRLVQKRWTVKLFWGSSSAKQINWMLNKILISSDMINLKICTKKH